MSIIFIVVIIAVAIVTISYAVGLFVYLRQN